MRLKFLFFAGIFLIASLTGCGKYVEETSEEGVVEQATSVAEKSTTSPETFKSFYVYKDKGFPGNHFIPSGWMGDSQDIVFNDVSMEDPHSGRTCIKIAYSPDASGGARWVGIYWQNPANNWGSKKRRFRFK